MRKHGKNSYEQHLTFTGILNFLSYFHFLSGIRLKDFDIRVGPYNGNYKRCGMARNTMVPGETKSYLCSPNAIGSTVKIQIDRFEFLTLCEVSIFGKGML